MNYTKEEREAFIIRDEQEKLALEIIRAMKLKTRNDGNPFGDRYGFLKGFKEQNMADEYRSEARNLE